LRTSPCAEEGARLWSRREALAALVSAVALGCGASPPPPNPTSVEERLPPLANTERLTDLLPLAGLAWILVGRPREIASIPWLIPSIGRVVPEENLNRFAGATGMDLRQIPEAVVAGYQGPEGESTVYLVRHRSDPRAIERLFRQRLTSDLRRVVERPDLIRLSGKIGRQKSVMVLIGREIIAVQHGGSMRRGPARIAALYAADKLHKSPTVLSQEPLRGLYARFGDAPARAMALGPFEGELARGARGLLAGATAIGAAARPSARERVALAIAIAGDFSTSGEAASEELKRAWGELAEGSFGHLLGLDQPVEAPLLTHSPDAVALAVELDPDKLAIGLSRATKSRIDEIMR